MRCIFFPCVLALAACARPPAMDPRPVTTAGPEISRLVPDHGPAGVDYPIHVTIEGRAFADTGNVVTFAGVPAGSLASTAGGTRIDFYVPKQPPAEGEVPPMPYAPGRYALTVTTPNGTSDPATFTLTAAR